MSDYQTIYPWLNKSLFETILRRDQENDQISVRNISVKSALTTGENYGSQMLRVTVEYTNESTGVVAAFPFIVKADLKKSDFQSPVTDLCLFQKEIASFEVILPAAHALLKSIGDDTVLAPRCFASSEEHSYLVFEDLSKKGFANINRHDGLGVQEYRLLFSLVAKWHATTAVLLQKDPSMFQMFEKPNIEKTSPVWIQMVQNLSTALTDTCRELPQFHHLVQKLESGNSTLLDRFCDASQRDGNFFEVLTHGDLWCNNIMFTTDSETGSSTNAIFVDFQFTGISSPAIDIMYTLFSSSHEDIIATDWEYLVQWYHAELSTCLKQLDYAGRIPTLSDLHVEMLRRGVYGAFFGVFLLAVRNIPAGANIDMEQFMGNTEQDRQIRKEIYLNPKCRKEMEFLISYCDRKGYYD